MCITPIGGGKSSCRGRRIHLWMVAEVGWHADLWGGLCVLARVVADPSRWVFLVVVSRWGVRLCIRRWRRQRGRGR